jgi:beta-glucanase (GH16 family)
VPARSRLATAAVALAFLAAAATAATAVACTPRTGAAPTAELDPAPGGTPPPVPAGRPSGWRPVFSDDFDGTTLNRSRWSDHSSAEPDGGRGNLDNQQLEWNQAANCQVGGGELVMTAKRERVTSPGTGRRYDWTSCLIASRRSYAFQYGFLEERAILPAARGFWPAFWTWPAEDVGEQAETDVYEFFSDNHGRLYSTQYSGADAGGRCAWAPRFDPSAGWHIYGVAIEPSGTTWYADGTEVCHADATSIARTAIMSNLAVYSKIPPEAGTASATKRVDYIRAWAAS